MVNVCRRYVYAFFLVFCICPQSVWASDKDGKEGKSMSSENNASINSADVTDQFQWREHNKLSWSDFRGAVKAATDESAAATDCGIGFRANTNVPGHKPEIIVYNTFYANKSWVRSDAKLPSILDHEQGHFDLCEIYTRKLRQLMSNVDFNVPDLKQSLMSIYTKVSSEYESRQQAYEQETIHGTNSAAQKKWREMMVHELM